MNKQAELLTSEQIEARAFVNRLIAADRDHNGLSVDEMVLAADANHDRHVSNDELLQTNAFDVTNFARRAQCLADAAEQPLTQDSIIFDSTIAADNVRFLLGDNNPEAEALIARLPQMVAVHMSDITAIEGYNNQNLPPTRTGSTEEQFYTAISSGVRTGHGPGF